MSPSPLQGKPEQRSQAGLQRALRLTLWLVPLLMGLIGAGYTLFENGRHKGTPGWPWPTFLGLFILGLVGPALSWICLRWATGAVAAYMASQEQLARRAEELASLNWLSLAASRSLEPRETIAAILEHTVQALDADAGMLFIQQPQEQALRLEAHRGISLHMAREEDRLAPGHCLCGQAVARREVLFAPVVGDDPRCTSSLCICEGFRSVACAPLEVKGQLVGLLQLASSRTGHFSGEQSDFLAAAAAQVGVSIENARLYDQLRTFSLDLEEKVRRRTAELEAARKALAHKAHQLQRLLGESYRVQEETQSRIAQDMHDGVTQMVIGALYETQAARQALFDNPDRAWTTLTRAQQLLTEVEAEMRRVIYDLHPPVLDTMGLVEALKRFTTTFSETFAIPCHLQVRQQPRRLPQAVELALYRIIQAALHNVARHAQASQATVTLAFARAAFEAVVEDDGTGFDPQENKSSTHLGLFGMKERAESVGASLQVDTAPGMGTRIQLYLPSPAYQELEPQTAPSGSGNPLPS